MENVNLLRRAKEYAEFYESTRNFNTLGFFNDLISYLEVDHKAQHAAECRDKALGVIDGVSHFTNEQPSRYREPCQAKKACKEAITKALTPEKNDG